MATRHIPPVQFEKSHRMPVPLDTRIGGGIAVWGALHPEVLDAIAERLTRSFDSLREDKSREFGACIAYTIDLPRPEQVALEGMLYTSAARQNHGVLTRRDSPEEGATIWMGEFEHGEFFIHRHEGHIVMDDGMPRGGQIYGLLGKSVLNRLQQQ